MNTQDIWAIAAIATAAFALASVTMAFAFARRVRLEGRSLILLLMLFTLAAFFGVTSWDALLHTSNPATPFTQWTLIARILQAAVATLSLHFFASSMAPMLKQAGQSPWLVYTSTLSSYIYFLAFVVNLYEAGWDPAWLAKSKAIAPPHFLLIFLIALNLVRSHLPEGQRGSWMGKIDSPENQLVLLNLSFRKAGEPLSIAATALDMRSLASAVLPALLVGWGFVTPDAPWKIALYVILQLAMLPSIAGLIYYQTRATFFDLLIKRGIVLAMLCLIAIAAPLGAALAITAMTIAFAWTLLYAGLDNWLDRFVFNRPDYRQKLTAITAGLATTEAPAAHVCRELAEALRSEWVRFGESPDSGAKAVVSVASPHKHWGFLSLGPRRRGLAYQSQDATFVDGVASQLAATLEGSDARAERQLATEAEVRALRAQINPHFLFNSLNSLADMVKDSPQTEETVLNLARVFRHSLTATQESAVPLHDELRFMESYLRIEQVRFEARLRFEIVCPADLCDTLIPPMLMQPLVENSIKHGLSPQLEGGSIRIEITSRSEALSILIADTGAGFDPANVRLGVGVENVRRRVLALPQGRFHIDSQPAQGARMTLEWKIA